MNNGDKRPNIRNNRMASSRLAVRDSSQHSRRRLDRLPSTTAASLSTMDSSPSSKEASRSRRRALSTTRKSLKHLRTYCVELAVQNTWISPLAIMMFITFLYFIYPDQQRNPIAPFIFLSYKVQDGSDIWSKMYAIGPKDICFCVFYTSFFSFTREFCMQQILRRIANHYKLRPGKVKRFMEQGYTFIYFGVTGPTGLVSLI